MLSNQAVIIVSVSFLYFVMGIVWRSTSFGQWVSSTGVIIKDDFKKDPTPNLLAFIGAVWTTYGMFLLIKHINPQSVIEVISLAISTWIFIVVGVSAKHYAFAQRKISEFMLNYIFDLVGLILMSLLIYKFY